MIAVISLYPFLERISEAAWRWKCRRWRLLIINVIGMKLLLLVQQADVNFSQTLAKIDKLNFEFFKNLKSFLKLKIKLPCVYSFSYDRQSFFYRNPRRYLKKIIWFSIFWHFSSLVDFFGLKLPPTKFTLLMCGDKKTCSFEI